MRKRVVLTGAGISKNAGIPTFEENPGIRDILTLDCLHNQYELLWETVKKLRDATLGKEPTLAHKVLADHNCTIITMNVDGLHQKAGSKSVLEVHGNLDKVECMGCKKELPIDCVYEDLFCPECHSKLRPKVALYGDSALKYSTAMQILRLNAGQDVLIVGTSYNTKFAYDFREYAMICDCKVYEFNTNADEELVNYFVNAELF